MLYIASNYSMGRAIKTVKIDAPSYQAAAREAERLMPTANGGPPSVGKSGKTRVIGVKRA